MPGIQESLINNTDNAVRVDLVTATTSTQSISGTTTANQGTGNAAGSPWAVSGTVTVLTIPVTLTSSPAVSGSGAYAVGASIGGKIVVSGAVTASAKQFRIETLLITDKNKQNADMAVVFWNQNPTSSTFTDTVALTIADIDLLAIRGIVPIASSDYQSFADNSAACIPNVGIVMKSTDTNLYAAIISRGTPGFASTSDIQLCVTLTQVN